MTSKKHKAAKVPIKEEKDELHPLSHYVGDPVELVKQIFSALKTKTIRNMAPESFKESSIQEIEELCLNELLGLSTKRLISIINSTKCPTDTESSNDSDVHNVEEHISLEEISSDSETERKRSSGKPGKSKKEKANDEGGATHEKGCSVLELLELQARARAIRSQLALEPVAKIEVDSDDSSEAGSVKEKLSAASSKNSTLKKKDDGSQSRSLPENQIVNGTVSTSTEKKTKRIKLKRNFRNNKRNNSNGKDQQSDQENSKKVEGNSKDLKKENTIKMIEADKCDNENERSPSPDVITILPSPETFCISDSSNEGEDVQHSKVTQAESITKLHKYCGETVLKDHEKDPKDNEAKIPESNSTPLVPDEVEDGEIVDHDESQYNDNVDEAESTKVQNEDSAEPINKDEDVTESNFDTNKTESPQSDSPKLDSPRSQQNTETEVEPTDSVNPKSTENESTDYGTLNHNDDAISLGHDDLEDEMRDDHDEETSTAIVDDASKLDENVSNDQIDEDIINLDDSSGDESHLNKADDLNQNQSWNYRWLQSDRVSKILATSRLGNRVRDKIKKSKKLEEKPDEDEVTRTIKKVFESQFEDGSIQQYAEILEREKSNI